MTINPKRACFDVSKELEEALRDAVGKAFHNNTGYGWLFEDIMEVLDEIVDDELDFQKSQSDIRE